MRLHTMSLLAAAALAVALPVDAQQNGRVVGGAGAVFLVGLPTGELAEQIDVGAGIGFNGHYFLVPSGAFRLRVQGGFIQYGSETHEACFSNTVGCRVRVDVNTANSIAFGSIGPELAFTSGYIRPYINAGIGASYFETASSIDGTDDSQSLGTTRHLQDTGLSITGGGGLYVPLSIRSVPLSLDLSARYHRNGTMQYLRKGDIQDNPDGSISFTPNRTEADFVTVQLGVSVGISRRGQ
ncbi:MAG: hypothetical protein WEE89_15060 [Gemmatimonadota bacterium]